MKPAFSIGIPTLNRFDLLLPALIYYTHDLPDTDMFICDNGHQVKDFSDNIDKTSLRNLFNTGYTSAFPIGVFGNGRNGGVAYSWNYLITEIFKNEKIKYAVILNDDIYWGRDQEDFNIFLAKCELEHKAEKHPGFILAPEDDKYDWCMFVINRAAWETIGGFDEKFYPAYFEDRDYIRRAYMAGINIYKKLKAPARFMHSGSSKKDKSLLHHAQTNRDYYVSKWGGEPGKETFTLPFNKQQ